MSLYRYVPGKTELLDLMLDAMHARGLRADPTGDWRDALEWLARRSRDRIQRHPWMLQVVVGQRPPLGPNIIGDFDAYLEAVTGIGLTPRETIAATELVGYFVEGATRDAIEAAQASARAGQRRGVVGRAPGVLGGVLRPRALPRDLGRVGSRAATRSPLDSFEFGLQRILDGIEALLAGR